MSSRVKRLEERVAHLVERLGAVKQKVKVVVDGPVSLDSCAVEGWELKVTLKAGKLTAEDDVHLTPRRIPVDLLVTGQKHTKVTVDVTINGTTKSRSFRMEGEQHGTTLYYTFKDFDLPVVVV